MGRTKTSINNEQYGKRSITRDLVSTEIGLLRTHAEGKLFFAGETISKIFTDINGNEYIKTYSVITDFTGSANFTNDLTNYLIDNSVIQNKADKLGAGFTGKVASLDGGGNLQSSGFDQSGLHTHANSVVLAAITDAGSGAIITALERSKLSAIEANAKNNLIADVGATGVSVYRDQTGSTFNLRKLDSANNKIGIAINADRVLFTLNEANISLNANQIVFTDTNGYLNATNIQAAIENLALQTRANTWRIGNEVAGDKYLRFAISAGPNDPGFRYLNSGTKLQYSNDGTTWNDIGGGGALASAAAYKTVNQTGVGPTIEFETVSYDTNTSISLTPWKYTAANTGDYDIDGSILSNNAGQFQILLFKNGSPTGIVLGISTPTSTGLQLCIIIGSVALTAGDYIDVRSDSGLSSTYYAGSYIRIKKAH